MIGNIDPKNVSWKLDPFPHAIIDDFLPNELFKKISSIDINTLKDQKRYNNNDIERKKAEFGSEGLTGVYEPVG